MLSAAVAHRSLCKALGYLSESAQKAALTDRAAAAVAPFRPKGAQLPLSIVKRGDKRGAVWDGVEAALMHKPVADGGKITHLPNQAGGQRLAFPCGRPGDFVVQAEGGIVARSLPRCARGLGRAEFILEQLFESFRRTDDELVVVGVPSDGGRGRALAHTFGRHTAARASGGYICCTIKLPRRTVPGALCRALVAGMSGQYSRDFGVPKDFPSVLKAFTREVLRSNPSDIYEFGANYFSEVLQQVMGGRAGLREQGLQCCRSALELAGVAPACVDTVKLTAPAVFCVSACAQGGGVIG